MKMYSFKTVKCSTSCGGANISFDEHREIIIECATQGLRYVGWVPTLMDGYGHIKEIDLIIEKQQGES